MIKIATIYELKPRFQALLRPLVGWLATHGVTANQVTIAAAGLSIAAGAAIALQPGATVVLCSTIAPSDARASAARLDAAGLMKALGKDMIDLIDKRNYGLFVMYAGGLWLIALGLLPMLIKLAKSRHKPLNEAVTAALAAGRKYIDSFDGG